MERWNDGLTPFLGSIYDLLDYFEVDRSFGSSDACVDLRIFEKIFADFFGFLTRCTRIYRVIHPSTFIEELRIRFNGCE